LLNDARKGGVLKVELNERFVDISYKESDWVLGDIFGRQVMTPSDSIYQHFNKYRDEFSDPIENETIKFEVSKSNENMTWTFKDKEFENRVMFKVSLVNTEETFPEGAWRLVCKHVNYRD